MDESNLSAEERIAKDLGERTLRALVDAKDALRRLSAMKPDALLQAFPDRWPAYSHTFISATSLVCSDAESAISFVYAVLQRGEMAAELHDLAARAAKHLEKAGGTSRAP